MDNPFFADNVENVEELMDPIHVLGISGSLRKGSYNTATLRAAAEEAPAGMSFEAFDLSSLPLFNEDLEKLGDPEPVRRLKERIGGADALLIATPEYNYSMSGVLKNAIDWASRPPKRSVLDGKPVAILGASPGMMGTGRAQYHLRQSAVFTNMLVLNRPEIFIAQAHQKFDENGRLTDAKTRELLRALLEALGRWTRQLRAAPAAGAGPRLAV